VQKKLLPVDVLMVLNYQIEGVINFMPRGYEIKEALRAQMEVQSKLHLQVEVNFIFVVQVVVSNMA
jgi:hypothetical protein